MSSLESHLQAQIDRSEDFFWHRLRWQAVQRSLRGRPPRELADIGAGAGLLGRYLARDLPTVRYTFEEPLASLENSLEEIYGADANVRGRTLLEADVVVLLDVLEHQEEDRVFLKDLLSRMRPGARLVVTVPALSVLWSPWDEQLGHYRRYSRRTLRSAFEGTSAKVVEVSYLFPELVPPALARKALPKRSGATGGAEGEFPQLPPVLDRSLYRVGAATQRVRRFWPFGSSLIAVAERV